MRERVRDRSVGKLWVRRFEWPYMGEYEENEVLSEWVIQGGGLEEKSLAWERFGAKEEGEKVIG